MGPESRFRFRVSSGFELDVPSPDVGCKETGGGVWFPAPCQMRTNVGIHETLPPVINRGIELPSSSMQSADDPSWTMWTNCLN